MINNSVVRYGALIGAALLLAACSSTSREKQVQPGGGTDDYKVSPCACLPVEMLPPDKTWRENIHRWQREQGTVS